MSKKRIFFALILTLVFAALATGQLLEDYRFKGKVVDTKGNPIPKVRITFHNETSGERFVFSTKENGSFDRRKINRAVYKVTFEKAGFVTRTETLRWLGKSEETVLKETDIVLESEAEAAKRDLGKKAGKLYREAFEAFNNSDWDKAYAKAEELLRVGAGPYEYAVRFIRARSEMRRGNIDRAIAEYRRFIELKPEFFEGHFDLAILLEMKGQHEDAIAEYTKASELDPEDAESQYEIGAVLYKLKRFDEATPHLKKAVELGPSHANANKALGYAYLQGQEKDIKAGLACLEKYLELVPEAEDSAQVQKILEVLKGTEGD